MESSSFARQLSELNTAANFTVRSVLELKRRQTAILLMGIRQDILAGSDDHFIYQQEALNVHMAIVASDWQKGVSEETKHVVAYRYKWTGLTYIQTGKHGSQHSQLRPSPVCSKPHVSCQQASFSAHQHDIALRGSVGDEAMFQAKREFHG